MVIPREHPIRIRGDVVEDLRARLVRTRWPESEPGWALGTDGGFLRRLVEYWREGYDWRAAEERLNAFPHHSVEVAGLAVHFIRVESPARDALPLVLTHGWPGSFAEFLAVIPRLADPTRFGGDARDAFHVVVPSIPGYGYSAYPEKGGLSPKDVAGRWAELMTGLGYSTFGAQGGDWGASVATWLARLASERVVGIHLNYIPGSYRPTVDSGELREEERRFLERRQEWYSHEGGYDLQQETRPLTLAYGLNDSPAGLAAWILEKIQRWSDCGGDPTSRFSLDDLIDNLMVYWLTGTAYSAARLYAEAARTPLVLERGERIGRPTGILRLAHEAPFPPRSWVERGYQVTRWTEVDRGGHFAAWEEPDVFVEDLREFFRPLRRRL